MTINGFRVEIEILPITTPGKSIRYAITGKNGEVTKGGADTLREAMRDIIGTIIRACARQTEREERRAS